MDSMVAKLFGKNIQPSIKRGAVLLVSLILFNVGVGITIIVAGAQYPVLSGLAVLAWGFGFRHAMDADHIAAIDNVTRRLLYRGKPSVGVGAFFSLGHSTIVFLLTIVILFFVPLAEANIDSWKTVGAVVGAILSSLFLILIGVINVSVLWKLVGAWRDMKRGIENPYHGHMHIGGPIEKLFRPLVQLTDKSYKMYFIGFLFGLGFDTATEVGLLAISALAVGSVPLLAILVLPLAFMAGMTRLDTVNGLCMLGIYTWGVFDAKRRILYNINITLLSLISAVAIGLTVGLRAIAEHFGLSGGIFSLVQRVSLGNLGYSLAALFVVSWFIALILLRPREKKVPL
ncbi:MAG: HoxN/HupN/NixA family nickel/cobalt transporter [bacterium]|nr:HoxN/HupN/NixA family nickel/cobalt transporter [bacterium]